MRKRKAALQTVDEGKYTSEFITINQSNLVPGSVNQYSLQLTNTVNFGSGSMVALSQAQLFYSWDNIGPEFSNNTVSIRWIDGNVINITIPAGIYQVTDISSYLMFAMQQQTWYLIDNNGNNQFYINLQVNVTAYKDQLNIIALPSSLPAGWNYPAGATWTTRAATPQLIITNANFGKLIGFVPGTYPASSTYTTGTMSQTASTTLVGVGTTFTAAMVGGTVTFANTTTELITAFTDATHLVTSINQTQISQPTNITYNNQTTSVSFLGTLTPQIAPISSVVFNCNLVNNDNLTVNSSQLWSINANGLVPGNAVTVNIPEYAFLPINLDTTRIITITLTDQLGNALVQRDTNSSFTLYVKHT